MGARRTRIPAPLPLLYAEIMPHSCAEGEQSRRHAIGMSTDDEPRARVGSVKRGFESLASNVVPVTITLSAHIAELRGIVNAHVDGSLLLQNFGSCCRKVLNADLWP